MMRLSLVLLGLLVYSPVSADTVLTDAVELGSYNHSASAEYATAKDPQWVACPEVKQCYSPGTTCRSMIIEFIDAAPPSQTIYMGAYNFTSDEIGDALIRAKKRGVEVKIILDYRASLQKGGEAQRMKKAGIDVWRDKKHRIYHNKVIVIGDAVELGSYNYSASAESNAENAIILYSVPEIAKQYKGDWEKHREHSVKY